MDRPDSLPHCHPLSDLLLMFTLLFCMSFLFLPAFVRKTLCLPNILIRTYIVPRKSGSHWQEAVLIDIAAYCTYSGARGSVVGWGTTLQAGGLRVWSPMLLDFFNWSNTSRRTMALGSTQPLTEMSTRNLHRGKRRPATTSPSSVSRLSRKCGSVDVS
jgi:hypothetical protein